MDDYVSGCLSDEEMSERLEKEYPEPKRMEPRVEKRRRPDNEEEREESTSGSPGSSTRPSRSAAREEIARGGDRAQSASERSRDRQMSRPGPSKITWAEHVERRELAKNTGAIPRDPRLRKKENEPGPVAVPGPSRLPDTPFCHHFVPKKEMTRDEYDPPAGSCHNCWSSYHRRGDCPRPAGRFCRNCGRKDTDILRCVRCRDDYPAWKAEDNARRKDKYRLKRSGKWEGDRSYHRGTHQPPRAPSMAPPVVSVPEPTTTTKPPTNSAGCRSEGDAKTASQPREEESESGHPSRATEEENQVPYHLRLERVMQTIRHLPPEMQMTILRPLIQAAEREEEERRVSRWNETKKP